MFNPFVNLFSLENVSQYIYSFKLTKERSRKYLAKTIPNADYADNIALRPKLCYVVWNKPLQSSVSMSTHTRWNICALIKQAISALNGSSLKLVDKFTYLGSSVSSPETDINTRLAKAWTTIDWLSVIWKSDLIDKIKRSFFQEAIVLILLYALHGR